MAAEEFEDESFQEWLGSKYYYLFQCNEWNFEQRATIVFVRDENEEQEIIKKHRKMKFNSDSIFRKIYFVSNKLREAFLAAEDLFKIGKVTLCKLQKSTKDSLGEVLNKEFGVVFGDQKDLQPYIEDSTYKVVSEISENDINLKEVKSLQSGIHYFVIGDYVFQKE